MSGATAEGPGRRRLTVAYDGTDFDGWQVQPGRRTVQGVLEDGLGNLFGQPVRLHGSGRTDAGVHALGQVCHLDDPVGLPLPRLRGALASALSDDVRLVEVAAVSPEFHALHGVRRKTYFYQLHLSREEGGQRVVERSVPPHRRRTFHAIRAGLDLEAMRAAARHLEGTHDFTTLSKAMSPGRGTVKTVEVVRLLGVPNGLRVFVTGDGFLYGMVRMLVAVLVEIGQGRLAPAAIPELLAAADRSLAPASLPGRGLFLWRVEYPPVLGSVLPEGLLD